MAAGEASENTCFYSLLYYSKGEKKIKIKQNTANQDSTYFFSLVKSKHSSSVQQCFLSQIHVWDYLALYWVAGVLYYFIISLTDSVYKLVM